MKKNWHDLLRKKKKKRIIARRVMNIEGEAGKKKRLGSAKKKGGSPLKSRNVKGEKGRVKEGKRGGRYDARKNRVV